MSGTLEIQKNVRIPYKNNQKFYELVDKMEIGDSILFEKLNEANSLRACLRRNGFKTAIRKEGDNQFRVWKQGMKSKEAAKLTETDTVE